MKLFAILLMLLSRTLLGSTCESFYAVNISEKQRAALSNLAVNFPESFSISVLEGEVDGVLRTVVIVGETHGNYPSAYRGAIEMFEHFPHHGLEGVEVDSYFLGRRLKIFINKMMTNLKNEFGAGSIIHASKMLKDEVGRESTFRIEQGHSPSLVENLIIFKLLLLSDHTVGISSLSVLVAFLAAVNDPEIVGGSAIIAPLLGYPILKASYRSAEGYLKAKAERRRLLRLLWQWFGGIVSSRDLTMSENILNIFHEDQNIDVLLTLVGADHVAGIGDNLIRFGSFQRKFWGIEPANLQSYTLINK